MVSLAICVPFGQRLAGATVLMPQELITQQDAGSASDRAKLDGSCRRTLPDDRQFIASCRGRKRLIHLVTFLTLC